MSWFHRPPLRSPFVAAEPTTDDGADRALRILAVCTGNVCRSAWTHHVLQTHLDEVLGSGLVEISSAGTAPNQALTVPRELLALAPDTALHAALAAHRPRPLTARVLAGQDLVLAATDTHLDVVVREAPALLRRSATILGGAARLDPEAVEPGGGARALASALRSRRPAPRGAADLPDPFGGPAEGYERMIRTLRPALDRIADAVARAVESEAVRR